MVTCVPNHERDLDLFTWQHGRLRPKPTRRTIRRKIRVQRIESRPLQLLRPQQTIKLLRRPRRKGIGRTRVTGLEKPTVDVHWTAVLVERNVSTVLCFERSARLEYRDVRIVIRAAYEID